MKPNELAVILLFAFVETSRECVEEANAQQPLKCYQGEQDLNIDGFIGVLEEPSGMCSSWCVYSRAFYLSALIHLQFKAFQWNFLSGR